MEIRFGRAEPYWGYQDVSSPARPVVISRGSWRRWEAVLSLSRDDDSGHEPPASSRSPLRAFASREHYLRALAPWLKGVSQQSELHDKVADKCQEFVCHDPEYCGSLHGGWDGPNQMFLEDGVSRGEFGEYLFNEFFGSGEDRFYRMGFDFGQIYRDLFCFTLPGASDGDHELGGAKSRQSEHRVDSIRSYRGAVLLTTMYQETGDERYLKAVRQRADYHLANYPHPVGRLSMANRDTAFMARYLQRPELIDKAVESILHSLDKHFDQEFGFFELYDESNELPDGRFPAHRIDSGMWFMRDFLFTVNASPERTVAGPIRMPPVRPAGATDASRTPWPFFTHTGCSVIHPAWKQPAAALILPRPA